MDNQQYYDRFMKAYSESSNSSANNTPTGLTLFHDLLQGGPQSEETNSGTSHQQGEDSYSSDCESVISREESERKPDNGLKTRMLKGEKIFEMIENKLVTSLSSHGFDAQVEAISQSDYSSSIMKQVKYRSYSLYSRGMAIKRNGNANVKYAWYGASRYELNSILDHGFSLPANCSGSYGPGVYLSPVDQPLQSFQSAIADENGVKHMLLCRVILGNMEVIRPGSIQHKPSSEEFDSGVHNLIHPDKYIVWNGDMNTHILPEFIVSFKSSTRSCKCEIIRQKARQSARVPKSDWMTFASLIGDLTKILPHDAVELISKHHSEYKKHKITQGELIQLVRNIAGDKLLITIIRSCGNRRSKHFGAAAKLAM